MSRLLFLTFAFLTTVPRSLIAADTFDWSTVDSQPQQARYILKRLRSWPQSKQKKTRKRLRVIYFVARDRQPIKDYVDRWDGIITDIQQFYRAQMRRLGYGDRTLAVERSKGKLKLHLVRGAAKDDGTYSYRAGGRIRSEVATALAKKGIHPNNETLLIVCGLSKTVGRKVTIYSPYYGMGANHNRGICFVADANFLKIDGLRPQKEKTILSVKEHRGYEAFTLTRFNTTYIGGTIHELGHGLSLPHNHATPQQTKLGTALMGAGNYTYRQEWRKAGKGSFLTHAHAIRLLVHPLFSGTTQAAARKPVKLMLKKLQLGFSQGKIVVSGSLKSAVPAIAVIAYNDRENRGQKGYRVNNDYDATTWTSVVNPQNEFRLQIGGLRDGNHQLRLVSVHANGATVVNRVHYSAKAGVPDLARARQEAQRLTSPK